mgnify:CR=1 FL=1|jgi:hypothetical protein
MGAVRVDVLCECEGCRKRFGVELDLAEELNGHDFDYLAREAIRGGQSNYYIWGVRGKATVDRLPLSGYPSVQGGRMLCDVCTKTCDAIPVDRNLTREEVDCALEQ